MTPRRRRLVLVLGIVVGVSIAGGFALMAFRDSMEFFIPPSKVAAKVKIDQRFRLGGMVSPGSVTRAPGSLEVKFKVTDYKLDLPVSYTGVLPDLFREGQGVIAIGRLSHDGVFVAEQVLAKHDEKYMPPQMEKQIRENHGGELPQPTPSTQVSAQQPRGM